MKYLEPLQILLCFGQAVGWSVVIMIEHCNYRDCVPCGECATASQRGCYGIIFSWPNVM